MASSPEFVDMVFKTLEPLGDIRYRKMFGEYMFYYKQKPFGGVYDNRFMIKITKAGREVIKEPLEELPYEGAKPMFVIADLSDSDTVLELVKATFDELPEPKRKNKKGV
ncbi:TfoX/Sxy family protein [Lachnospiraceae bacterium NSJ-143]|nr:TfoX/Sxy family protein [Lachnospiraceae bacterium NSJ-143]